MTELAQAVLSIGWFGLLVAFAALGVCAAVIVTRASAARGDADRDVSNSGEGAASRP